MKREAKDKKIVKKAAKKGAPKEKVIIKEVIQEVVKKVVKEEYEVVNIPSLEKCMVCSQHPILEYNNYDSSFIIRCHHCNAQKRLKTDRHDNLYIGLCKLLKEWKNMFAHLQPKKTEALNEGHDKNIVDSINEPI